MAGRHRAPRPRRARNVLLRAVSGVARLPGRPLAAAVLGTALVVSLCSASAAAAPGSANTRVSVIAAQQAEPRAVQDRASRDADRSELAFGAAAAEVATPEAVQEQARRERAAVKAAAGAQASVSAIPAPPPVPSPAPGAGPVPPPGAGPVPPPGGDPAANRELGRSMVLDYGWDEAQFGCIDRIWTQESGWRTDAENRSSGAYGIPQALPAAKLASAGEDWRTNPATQIAWGLDYIATTYGTPCSAWDFKSAHGWY